MKNILTCGTVPKAFIVNYHVFAAPPWQRSSDLGVMYMMATSDNIRPYSAGTVTTRQTLAFMDVMFWRLKTVSALKD